MKESRVRVTGKQRRKEHNGKTSEDDRDDDAGLT